MTLDDLRTLDSDQWTGDEIRSLRRTLRITQQELADLLGFHGGGQSTVSVWETGAQAPGRLASRLLTIVRELHAEGAE